MKFEFSGRIFEKCSKVKLNENSSSGSRQQDGRADGHDEASSRFSQFCERATNYLSYRHCNLTRAYIVLTWITS